MLKKFKTFADEQKTNNFCCYEWSNRIVTRGKQVFAIFGKIAYDVTKQKFNFDKSCVPGTGKLCISIEGKYLAEFPDEGNSGIMGMYIINRNGENVTVGPTFVICGWLWTRELDLTNEEIMQNITEEILDGQNVLTNKPAGWA